ncbi:transaldolase [Candidatus Omnitrophota bacterium]
MTKTTVEKLNEFGQSIWLDNISRSMLEGGGLEEMIRVGLRGMTSNPTIFDKAIRSSNDYNEKIQELAGLGKSIFEIYDDLTVKDVQDAADIFKAVYDRTGRLDGYVSLEVSPKLAFKTDETLKEAERLFKKVNRPNVMFKIPATDAGFIAIEELLAQGINVNATLIFSAGQYVKTAHAFLKGIGRLLGTGKDLSKTRSVASVFVSRADTAIDNMIEEKNLPISLKGKAAVANSKVIFQKYLEIFSGDEFRVFREKGANAQRVLWASTSTKNPAYSDIKYVTELIGKNTVNTLPENTFQAFLDHGVIEEALGADASDKEDVLKQLKDLEIDVDIVCERLLHDGLVAFEKSFDALLSSINKKAGELCSK